MTAARERPRDAVPRKELIAMPRELITLACTECKSRNYIDDEEQADDVPSGWR